MEENNHYQTTANVEASPIEASHVESSNVNQTPTPQASQPMDPKIKKLALIITGVIVGIVILLIAAFFALNWYIRNEELKPNEPITQASPTPITTSESETNKLFSTISLPQGWKKEIGKDSINNYEYITISSPDYKKAASYDWPGLTITIRKEGDKLPHPQPKTYEQRYKEILDNINDPNPGGATYHDLEKTTIAGKPALSYYLDFEGHEHFYEIWNNEDVWFVTIRSANTSTETKNKNEINQILSTVNFNSDNEISGWKTHIADGYSYQYPSNWYSPTEVSAPQAGPFGGGVNSGIHIKVLPNPSNLSINDFAQEEINSANENINPPSTKILDTPSYFLNKDIIITNGFPGAGIELLRAYIPNGNSIYEIAIDGVVGEETGLKLLSTFKFTK